MHFKTYSIPPRTRLFQAITCTLVLAASVAPVSAQTSFLSLTSISGDECSTLDNSERQACQQTRLNANRAFTLRPLNTAVGNPVTPGNGINATTNGELGNPDSWRSEEFEQDWGLGTINAHHAYARGLTGEGIRIGLFDSGVGLQHTEFAGKDHRGLKIGDQLPDGSRCAADKYLSGDTACFGTDGGRPSIDALYIDPKVASALREPYSQYGGKIVLEYGSHGTHVAGTMAANRDGKGMHGVAFNATFNSARLFADSVTNVDFLCAYLGLCGSKSTSASTSAFVDMYQQMNADNVRAINHSWGLSREPIDAAGQDRLYKNPANASRWETIRDGSLANGMIQVWAAGNSGENPSPESSPIAGAYASLPRHMPELEQYWVSVVNVSRTNDDANPYTLSNRSMKCGLSMNWCLAAPGTVINSSVYGGIAVIDDTEKLPDGNYRLPGIDQMNPEFNYADYSGTSMAAPHVTGALALLFQRYPYLTNAQVRDVMLTTATDMGAPGVDEIYGWGMLNLQKAIEGYGQFRVNTDVTMVAKAGGAHIWNDARVWDVWTNDIGGPGHFSFTSPNGGWLRLSGSNSFNGLTVKSGVLELTGANTLTSNVTVNGGLLMVNGNGVLNNATTVNTGGTLGGTGTVNGNVTVAGTMAPGASIGTLTINGDYVQQAGSYFNVEMQPPSATDKLVVNGTATLEGGTVRAIRMPGVYMLGQSYDFLTASGGITGTFAGVDMSGLSPFLDMQLRYNANGVSANMVRGAALASVGTTHNQIQTGTGLDKLPDSNALLQSLVLLPDAASANRAFDQLSGEVHSTARGVLADDSRHVRNAALARARTGHDAFTGQSSAPGFAAWAELLTSGGALQGNNNAAYTRYSGHHALVGGDYQFDGGFRVGVLGGVGRTDANIGKRDSKAEIRNRMVGIYGGQRFGGFGVHAGLVHTTHDIDGGRKVAFTGFTDDLQSKYDGTTSQAFVELGYAFGADAWQIEPYLQYANVQVKTNAFSENGGLAALSVGSETNKLDVATAGLRFGLNLKGSQQEETWLSLRGGLGYRQASGDVANASTMSFAGGTSFNVQGAPLAKKATVGELGIAARITERTMLELGYSGQFADEGNDHGANARLSIKF